MKFIQLKKQYVNNKNPSFKPRINNLQKNEFILSIIKLSNIIDVTKSEINSIAIPIDSQHGDVLVRFRKLNKHRAIAMQAIVQAMLYHFNVNTKEVEASIEQLSDECGLSTVSQSGNKSISRASRLISEFMEPMGFVKCKKLKDKKGTSLKNISLTPLFFMLFDPPYKSMNYTER